MRNSGAERLFSPVLHGSDQKMSAISNSFFWLYRYQMTAEALKKNLDNLKEVSQDMEKFINNTFTRF